MNPAFLIPIADEGAAQLESCLGFLRASYPDAPALVVSDGVSDPSYPNICRRFRAGYEPGAFLKRIECGASWWRRFFSLGLALDRPWLVKLDADARVWRPFEGEPRHSIAGTLENAGTDAENVQGGVQAIRADAARKILARDRFNDSALRSEWTFHSTEAERRWVRAQAYLSTDKTLGWLARDAGVDWGDWHEIGSRWKPPAPTNGGRRFAATHPHKLEKAPRFEGATLHVVTTVKGRLDHLRRTLPGWLEPGVVVTVVDYGCPQGTAGWLRANHPGVRVVKVSGVPTFSLPGARNIGAAHLPAGVDWVCFFDADWTCSPGWSDAVRRSLRAGRYLLADPIEWGQFGSVVTRLADFQAAGGYDELFTGWGAEDGDFYSRLRQVGVRPGSMPGAYFRSIPHDDSARVEHYAEKDKRRNQRLHDLYHHRKVRRMVSTGRLTRPDEDRALKLEAYDEAGIEPPAGFYPYVPDPSPLVEVIEAVVEALVEDVAHAIEAVASEVEHLIDGDASSTATNSAHSSTIDVGGIPFTRDEIEYAHDRAGVFGRPFADSDGGPPPPSGPVPSPVVAPAAPGGFAPGSPPVAIPPPTVIIPKARPMLTISLINESTHDLGLTLDALAGIGEAYLKLVDGYWPGTAARVIPSKVILPRTRAIVLVDHSDQAQALGYHALTPDGYPCGQVAVLDSLTSGDSVASVLTHELAELQVDPYLNKAAVAADGTVYAMEVGDPVQGDSFKLEGQLVSDFATQAWFEAEHAPGSTKFDYLGLLKTPFTLRPGGYASTMKGGAWTQIFGDVATEQAAKRKPLGRLARRRAKAARQATAMHAAYLAVDHRAATR